MSAIEKYVPEYIKGYADGNRGDTKSIKSFWWRDYDISKVNASKYLEARIPPTLSISKVEKDMLTNFLASIIFDQVIMNDDDISKSKAFFNDLNDAGLKMFAKKIANNKLLRLEEVVILIGKAGNGQAKDLLLKVFNKMRPYAEKNYNSIVKELAKDKTVSVHGSAFSYVPTIVKSKALEVFIKLMDKQEKIAKK